MLVLYVYSAKPHLDYYCLSCQSMYLSYVCGYTPPMRFLLLVLRSLGCHWIYYVLRPCPATPTDIQTLNTRRLYLHIALLMGNIMMTDGDRILTTITNGLWPLSDRIPSTTPGAEPPRDAKDSGSARSHPTHVETSSSNLP